jgi:DNA-binding beta-propeller fold protein YncE
MRIPNVAFALVAAVGGAIGSAYAVRAAAPPLILEQKIPLNDVSGRIDHMAVDVAGKRLFVAELGNGSVDVVDLQAGKVIKRISGLKEPQGLAYIADLDLIVVASAGDGSVRFFRAADLSSVGTIALGDDADNVRIDPATGHVLVGYGDGGLAIINPATRSKLDDIPLAGHPESFQVDPRTDRVYVNVPTAHQIAVVDLTSHKQIAAWKAPGLRWNFPMALADAGGPLAVVFRGPPKLVILNPATGSITASVETCGDADDVFFDRKRDRFYVSCGEGAVDVVQRNLDGGLRVEHVTTSSGGRTSIFVPQFDWLFVAARAWWPGSAAAILVYRPSP